MDPTVKRFQRGVEDLLSSCNSDADSHGELDTERIERQLSVLLSELSQIQKHNAYYGGSGRMGEDHNHDHEGSNKINTHDAHHRATNRCHDNGGSNNYAGFNEDEDEDENDNDFIRTSISYNNKKRKISLRDLFHNSDLAFELSALMSHRNYNQDDGSDKGNGACRRSDGGDGGGGAGDKNFLGRDSWTVSATALMAGRLFIELSAISGAWGIGWIDVGIMRNLEALVRRWGDECKGRQNQKKPSRKSDARASNYSTTNNSRISNVEMFDIPAASYLPLLGSDSKRVSFAKKGHKRARFESSVGGDPTENDFGNLKNCFGEQSSCTSNSVEVNCSLNHRSFTMYGLQLVHSLGNALRNTEYVNWSKDARDAILDASISAFGICCALSMCPHSHSRKGEDYIITNVNEVEYSSTLTKSLGCAIKMCVVNNPRTTFSSTNGSVSTRSYMGMNENEILNNSIISQSYAASTSFFSHPEEIVVLFLRGLYPLLTFQIDLPNGVKGKAAAFNSGCSLIVDVLSHLSTCVDEKSPNKMTPARSVPERTNKTPNVSAPHSCRKTPRSKRKSLDGNFIVPPSLKKTVTPKTRYRKSLLEQQKNENPWKSRAVTDIFVGLMQKISTSKGMEKIDVRTRVSDFIKKCLFELPHAQREVFLRFAVKLCYSKVSVHRIFGVELIGNFLSTDWLLESFSDNSEVAITMSDFLSKNSCGFIAENVNIPCAMLFALHGRINDSAPAVRSRAAIALSAMLKSYNSTKSPVLQQLIKNFKAPCVASVRKRIKIDDKSAVRKAAIAALVELVLIRDEEADLDRLTEADISVLCQMCNDTSIGVRKAAVDSIILLIEKQHQFCLKEGQHECQEMLESAWANAVLPLVYDIEVPCINRVVESFASIIIEPICAKVDKECSNNYRSRYNSAWRILSGINTASSSTGSFKGGKNAIGVALHKYLEGGFTSDICVTLLTEIRGNIMNKVQNKYTSKDGYLCDKFIGSWCLLESIISVHCTLKSGTQTFDMEKDVKVSLIGTEFLEKCWDWISQLDSDSMNTNRKIKVIAITKSCLSIFSAFAPLMTEHEALSLFHSLHKYIRSFHPGIDIIGSSISALVQITNRLYGDKSLAMDSCKKWIQELFDDCEGLLTKFISSKGMTSPKLDKALYAIGELSMVGFHPSEELSVAKGGGKIHGIKDNSVVGLYTKTPISVVNLVQSLLLPSLPSTDVARKIPSKLRAHAFVAFGKICLRDEHLARDSINIFARELRQDGVHNDPAVKSNALLVLGDFVVRYTHHADKFLPLMASCLQLSNCAPALPTILSLGNSSESIVRHHAILILSNLILKDYIKWRGVLFYRFLAATVDEDPTVSSLAKLFLCGPLLSKQPTLFFNNFVDSLFILNGCTAHPMFTSGNRRESLRFQADGLNVFIIKESKKREEIYSLLLNHMSPEEKIGVTARLSKEVLSAATAVTGEIGTAARSCGGQSSNGGAYAVLSDCLQVLTSSKMSVGRSSTAADESEINSSILETSVGPQLSSAKGKLLTKINRKQLVETVLPILSTLKITLEKSHSPLLKNLMQYLVCIFSQFNKEVNEFLASDKTLLQEIKYDIRRQSMKK